MHISQVFQRILSKAKDMDSKEQMIEDVVETICTMEKEFPSFNFCYHDAPSNSSG